MLPQVETIGRLRAQDARDLITDKEEAKMWINNKSFKIWIIQTYEEITLWLILEWTPKEVRTIMTNKWDKQDMLLQIKWDSLPLKALKDSSNRTWMDNL